MNAAILKKCIDELQKEPVRKDYVLGLLESLYEYESQNVVKSGTTNLPTYGGFVSDRDTVIKAIDNRPHSTYTITAENTPEDEGVMMDLETAAKLRAIKG